MLAGLKSLRLHNPAQPQILQEGGFQRGQEREEELRKQKSFMQHISGRFAEI